MNVIEETTRRILERIADGRYQPGERLPSEPKLAASFGVSRSSLREAIRGLSQARVLEVRRGDGTFVSRRAPEHLLGDLSSVLELMPDAAAVQAFEVRHLLEPAATALATLRVTDPQVDELQRNVETMRAASDVHQLVALDREFHQLIVTCTGNPLLCSLVEALVVPSAWSRFWIDAAGSDVQVAVVDHHTQIVRAIEARDPGLAAAASAAHLSTFEEWLRAGASVQSPGMPGPGAVPALLPAAQSH